MPRISRAPSTHCPGLSISPFQLAVDPVDPMLQWTICLCSHTGALGRGEAGCFPIEVAGLWEPGPKVLGVPVCRSCTLTTRLADVGCMTMHGPTRFILKQSQPFLHGSEILFFDIEMIGRVQMIVLSLHKCLAIL